MVKISKPRKITQNLGNLEIFCQKNCQVEGTSTAEPICKQTFTNFNFDCDDDFDRFLSKTTCWYTLAQYVEIRQKESFI